MNRIRLRPLLTIQAPVPFFAHILPTMPQSLCVPGIREGSFILICIGLAGFGFFGFSAYPMALELAAEATYPIDASISESWVHVNVQVRVTF